MKNFVIFLCSICPFVVWGQDEFLSKSNNSKLSDATLTQINQRLRDYEIVDFDYKSLDKYLKNGNGRAKIKLGKTLSGTWNFEENEMRSPYIGKSKYNENGEILNGVELAETYIIKSDESNSANIRLFVSPNLISGFIHDKDSFIRIESLSNFLHQQNDEYTDKVIIYDDRNAIIVNELKCGVISKHTHNISPQSSNARITTSNARIATNGCNRLLKIAVEMDDEFAENVPAVMQEVDYILNLNFGIRISYMHKPWNSGNAGYPYSMSAISSGPGVGRYQESEVFNRFQNSGWIINNLPGYAMYHFITGKKLYSSTSGDSGGYAPGIPICGSQKPLSISSTEFSGTQQIARTMCHELGHNLSGNTYHDTNCNSCPDNTIMCTFVSGTGSGTGGCRGLYYSSTSISRIDSLLNQNSTCLGAIPAPVINQVYLSGNLINSTPYFTSIRSGNMSVDVTNNYSFFNNTVYFTPSNSAVLVSGNPNTIVSFNVPNSVSSYTMNISAANDCGTSYRSVPIVYGSGFRLYPNPATTVTYLEFDTDLNNAKNDLFLPQSVTLKSEKNEVLKKNQPKQDFIDKKLEDGKRIKWDVSSLLSGIYYIDIVYSEKNTFTVRLLIQR